MAAERRLFGARVTERLKGKGVELRILDLGLDTATPTGELMLNLLGAIAQFERQVNLERQRAGIAAAKAAGKYRGHVPTARRQGAEITKLRSEGVKPVEVAAKLGVSRSSAYRVLAEARNAS